MRKTNNNITKYWKEQPELFNNSYKQKSHFTTFVHFFLNLRFNESTMILKKLPLKSKHILDAGCGGGQYLEYFLNNDCKVTGVDYSAKMISIADRYLKSKNLKNYSLTVTDVHKLPYQDNIFDLVIAVGLLEYLENPEQAMEEFTRVLKPKGYFLLSFSKKNSPFLLLRTFPGVLLRIHLLKLPKLKVVFDINKVNFLLETNKIKLLKKKDIMFTEWLILGQKK